MKYVILVLVFVALVANASAVSIDATNGITDITPTASADTSSQGTGGQQIDETVAWHEFAAQNAVPLLTRAPGEAKNILVSASTVEGTKYVSGTLTDGSEVKIELAKLNTNEAEARFIYRSASTPTPTPLSPRRGERVAVSPSSGPQLGHWTTELVVNEKFSEDSLIVSFMFPTRQDLNFKYTIKSKGGAAIKAPQIAKSAASPTAETFSVEFIGFGRTITGELSQDMTNPPVVQEISNLLKGAKVKPAVIHAADRGLIMALEESSVMPLKEGPPATKRERVLCALATGLGGVVGGLISAGIGAPIGAGIVNCINQAIL